MESIRDSKRGQKLLYLLSSLSDQEKKDFRSWLKSPLFGKSPQSVILLDIIEKKVMRKGLSSISFDLFASALSPEKPMDARKEDYIRIRLIQLQDRLLDFLANQRGQANPALRNRFLLEEAISRGWEKYIPEFYRRASKQLSKLESGERMLQTLQLEEILNGYLAQRAVKGMDIHLGQLQESLDSYFILQKLKFACAAVNMKLAWNVDEKVALLEPVLQELERDESKWPAVIRSYYHACKMLTFAVTGSEESAGHFGKLLALMENMLQYEPADAHTFFLYAQNYCTIRFYQGHKQYITHLKTLYDRMLNSELLLENGFLSSTFYTNTVMLMCRFGELEWTEGFIFKYRKLILGEFKGEELAFTYNLAVLRFYQKHYRETIALLYNQIGRFEDPLYSVGARTYLCRALWEQADWDWLMGALHSFRQFLRRNARLGRREKANAQKFVSYLEKMARAKSGNPEQTREKLLKIKAKMESEGNPQFFGWVAGALGRELA